MDKIDELKILIALLAASNSIIRFFYTYEKGKEKEFAEGLVEQYFILLVRITILTYSIKYKWPLEMCATISIIISALTSQKQDEED